MIVTGCSFIVSLLGVIALDAIPVFADIDPHTFNLDPSDVARKVSPRTKAIIPVHLFGQLCEMDAILAIAREHNLVVIEVCAQAYGCVYRGRMGGTLGHLGAFSLRQSKHITTGEGGLAITSDRAMYERASMNVNIGFTFIHD